LSALVRLRNGMRMLAPLGCAGVVPIVRADSVRCRYDHLQAQRGPTLVISRTGYTGELGYELYLRDASRDGLKLWDALIQAGEPHGLSPTGPCHIRRIEGGILAHDCDMTIEENPYEVGYGYKWMVELEQEQDFIGRDALRVVHERGVDRKLVGVQIGGAKLGAYNDGSMPDFFPVRSGGREIGRVTSACYSPRLDRNIGYAMVLSSTPSSVPSSRSSGPMRRSPASSPTECSSSPSTPSSRSPPADEAANRRPIVVLRRPVVDVLRSAGCSESCMGSSALELAAAGPGGPAGARARGSRGLRRVPRSHAVSAVGSRRR
jgi:Aminomethyltransferase folate-binding domain/Glycine cleavage T-protein C-terminal barrel domain